MTASQAPSDEGTMDAWRTRLLASILRLVLVLGAVAAVPSMAFAARTGLTGVLVIDVVALAALAGLTFSRRLPYRARAIGLLVAGYLVGVALLGTVGIVSHVYLMAVPVLAAVLLGLRPALVALGVNAVTLVAAGLLGLSDQDLRIAGVESDLEWLVISGNVLFVNAVLAVSCAVLLDRFERSLRAEHAQRLSLSEQRTRLARANDRLAAEIAEREQVERRLGHLAAAVEQADDVVLTADTTGRIVYVNPVLHGITGDDHGTIDHLTDLPQDDEVARSIMDALVAGRDWTGTVGLRTVTDNHRELDTRIAPVRDAADQVTGFVAVLRDVTKARMLDARLNRAERMQALATLASGTAHDFNNVLGSILAVAESTRRRADDPVTREEMAEIVRACGRARGVVEQMMELGRRPDDRERRPVSASAVLEGTLRLVRAALPARIELVTDLTDDAHVVARPADLDQVVTNLAANAAQAMAATSDATLTITLERARHAGRDPGDGEPGEEDRLLLRVRDTGSGMDQDTMSRVFDPFFTTREDGTGLGLASVHTIVTSLGGEVTVGSLPGEGTTFTVSLPLAAAPEPAATSPDEPSLASGHQPGDDARDDAHPVPGGRPGRAGRILLVDDEPLILQMTARSLVHTGYTVTTATSGDDARARFDEDPDAFDVVVTDLSMPGISGTELVRHVHRVRPEVAAILCSGFGDMAADELRDTRLHAYLAKPYTLAELAARIDDALASGDDRSR